MLTQFINIPLFQYVTAFTVYLGAIANGMHYGWTSVSLPKLLNSSSYVTVGRDEASWITTALLCGTVCGSVLTGFILDRLGRKVTLLISSIPFFVSWLLIAFSSSVHLLLTARFVAGVGDGLIQTCLPIYIGEIADAKLRGLFGSLISVLWFFGMLLINVIGVVLDIKTSALVASSIPALFFLVFVWLPDSPYYLMKKGDVDKARRSLQILTGLVDVSAQFKAIQDAVMVQNKNNSRFVDIVNSADNRRAFGLLLAMRTIQQMCGVTAIMFYAQIIIKDSSGDIFSPEIASIIYFGMYVVCLVWCSILVDKVGRKPLLIFSVAGSGLVLLIDTLYIALDVKTFSWIPVAAIIAYAVFYGLGMQSIPILMQAEFIPLNIKAKAVSIFLVYTAVIVAIVFKIFQITSENFGIHVPLAIFTCSCFVGLVFIIWFVPETKGKTLEEIQQILSRGVSENRKEIENTKM